MEECCSSLLAVEGQIWAYLVVYSCLSTKQLIALCLCKVMLLYGPCLVTEGAVGVRSATGMVIGLVPTKPVATNLALVFRNVVSDSCPHITPPAAQYCQCLQTHLCSGDVNGLWKVIPLTLELEALWYVFSLQGAWWSCLPSHSCLLGKQDSFYLLFCQYGTCWGRTVEGDFTLEDG